ncbi:MAG TPA: hypothetical protein VG649_05115 [Candidatus Angelobacter sp.]|nr:hypothetical protein [Candidatus Angelobacter sp.]
MDDRKLALEGLCAAASYQGQKSGLVAPPLGSLDVASHFSGIPGRYSEAAMLAR